MKRILDWEFLNNPLQSYFMAAGVILIVVLFKRYLSRYIAGLIFQVIHRVAKGVEKKSFINLVVAPLNTFLVILVSLIAIDKLNFPTALNFNIYKASFKSILETASIIVLIISFIWLLLRIIDFVALILEQKANLTADHTDNQLIVFFKDFFKVVFIVNGILMILKFGFHFNIASLITGLSIAGAAIALSLRESLENLIASFIIFFDKPFRVGDQVKVHTITGTVEKIGLRSTRIRSDQKTFVTVPNKQMVDSITDNLTLRSQRRAFVQLEISSDTPREKLEQLIKSIEASLDNRRPVVENYTVFLADINKNAFFITVEFFTSTIPIGDFNRLRQVINMDMIRLMADSQIRLASKDQDAAAPVTTGQ